ncbi:MAG: MBOAT family protein [Victivallales bacterium]|nr:MBOAT family protein [Victivallales bacterium]
MVFSSYLFLFFFLPLALAAYYLSPKKIKHLTLTLFSYAFYGWANPSFMLLMWFTTTVDYTNGRIMGRPGSGSARRRKLALLCSIVVNLSVLAFFKYFNFGMENYNALMAAMGIPAWQFEGFFRVVLPLGISFYTFQSMSYVVDVYRGDAEVVTNYIDYACYVSMFPQLVAGPIVRFQDIADQLRERSYSWEKFARGVAFFALGMGKKILLANPCGKIADVAFNAVDLSVFDAWYGLVAYSFQIYFDFSGYSDMAIGLGLMLGFVFAKNFDSPYKSRSITEFWKRWHMSLSTWLRDYLYIPLGGNRKGQRRTYINLALVMLLGGLWHGASWNFLIWGGIHGGYLAFERAQGKESIYHRLPRVMQVGLTFFIVMIAWVFFRADTLPDAWRYFSSLFGGAPATGASSIIRGLIYNPYYLLHFIIAGIVVWALPQTWDFTRKITWPKIVWCILVFGIALIALTTQSYNPFIYFIF